MFTIILFSIHWPLAEKVKATFIVKNDSLSKKRNKNFFILTKTLIFQRQNMLEG